MSLDRGYEWAIREAREGVSDSLRFYNEQRLH